MYLRFCLLSILLSLTSHCAQPNNHTPSELRIIGGREAGPQEFREVVAIRDGDDVICSGTVIGVRTILSAAHCFEQRLMPPTQNIDRFSVFVGVNTKMSDGAALAVQAINLHPAYWQDPSTSLDMALVTTTEDLPTPVAPLLLDLGVLAGFLNEERKTVTIAGYGVSDNDQGLKSAGIKRIAETTTMGRQNNELLIGNHQSDTCTGDSGGPAFAKTRDGSFQLMAVTSRGPVPCAQERNPGIMPLARSAICWLQQQLHSSSLLWNEACLEEQQDQVLLTDSVDENAISLTLSHRQLADIRALKNARQLTSVDLSSNRLQEVSVLLDLPNLRHVDLRNNRLRDLRVIQLLRSRGVQVEGDRTQTFNYHRTEFARLAKLGIQAGPENRQTILALRQMLAVGDQDRKSRDLNARRYLGFVGKNIASLEPLAKLENLESLILNHNPDIQDFRPLLSLPRLNHVELIGIEATEIEANQDVINTLRNHGVSVITEGTR